MSITLARGADLTALIQHHRQNEGTTGHVMLQQSLGTDFIFAIYKYPLRCPIDQQSIHKPPRKKVPVIPLTQTKPSPSPHDHASNITKAYPAMHKTTPIHAAYYKTSPRSASDVEQAREAAALTLSITGIYMYDY